MTEHITPVSTIVGFPGSEARETIHDSIEFAIRPRASARGETPSGAIQWLQSFIAQLRAGEALTLRIAPGSGGIFVGVRAAAPGADIGQRTRGHADALRTVLASALPHFAAGDAIASGQSPHPFSAELEPAGRTISIDELAEQALRAVPVTMLGSVPGTAHGTSGTAVLAPRPEVWLPHNPHQRPDMAAIAALMTQPALELAELQLSIAPFRIDAAPARAIAEVLKGLSDRLESASPRLHTLFHLDETALAMLKQWCIADRSLIVSATLSAPEPVSPVLLDMMCQAIYGSTRRRQDAAGAVDLTTAWPGLDVSFLDRLPAIVEAETRIAARRRARHQSTRHTVLLGRLDDGTPLRIDQKALAQHLYFLGATDTGKSTAMLNLIAQDMKAGRAVLVIDAHGDLYEKAQKLVPRAREKDLILLHPTDPAGIFTMNALETAGGDVATEHARVVDELLDLFKRTLWRRVPEAFGPMFMNYFRNALLLLLDVERQDASILSLQRVFGDNAYRRDLTSKCSDPDVRFFWQRIAEETHGESGLDNHAPYIISKLTPITGNPTMKRILGANRSSIDFRNVIADGRICLVNLAQPSIGAEAARFLGGIMTSRLVAAAKSQSALAVDQRPRMNVYMDEFQTYISAALADGLAEVRKFGLNLVLANQGLGQLEGDSYQADIIEAVLANVSSVVAFRVGQKDAARLAVKFEPDIGARQLMRLPNYHAAAHLLSGNELATPMLIATEPEPRPLRHPHRAQLRIAASDLSAARVDIVRKLMDRSAG